MYDIIIFSFLGRRGGNLGAPSPLHAFISCHRTFYHTYRRFVVLERSIVLVAMTIRSSTSLPWVETLTQDHWLPLR